MSGSISYGGFFFATANNLGSVAGNYCAGKIKREIISLLDMEDDSILEKSDRVASMLLKGDDYRKHLVYGDKKEFEDELWKFREKKELSGKIDVYGEIPYSWDDESLEEIGIDSKAMAGYDSPASFNDYLKGDLEKSECRLKKCLSYRMRGQFDKDAFIDWRNTLLEILCETGRDMEEFSTGDKLDEKKKVRAAAIYWILSVFV